MAFHGTLSILVLLVGMSAAQLYSFARPRQTTLNRPVLHSSYDGRRQQRHQRSPEAEHKVEALGERLKKQVTALRNTSNGQVELIFLVDDSNSVGRENFLNELNFVKKLLADFTVDQDSTRVAVVAYSSEKRIRCEIDHLSASARHEHHKCSLLQEELPKVVFKGGGTYTLGALRKAKDILVNARPSAQKVIFLITDGYSNSGDPRPVAKELKQAGAKIFTIGIWNGNEPELRDMATEGHCYILDSFDEFEALARRALHEDLQRGNYILQRAEKCNRLCQSGDCCDLMAACRCGTHIGKYECVCRAGFYGNGLKGRCRACPSGTYKNVTGPGDLSTCTKCPDMNQHSPPGSTSVAKCRCKTGYIADGALKCAAITCPKVQEPPNGYMVSGKCNNVVNAACGIRCSSGFKLIGSSVRLCQVNGTWTGVAPTCEVRKCDALRAPSHGSIKCSKEDFSFGSTCEYSCDQGYYLVGSKQRTCMGFVFWNGLQPRCREVTCKPLPDLPSGKIVPGHCTDRDMPYSAKCTLLCRDGYKLNSAPYRVCDASGNWNPQDPYRSECIDVTRPDIQCPRAIVADAITDEDYARITWFLPSMHDNSGELPTLSVIPIMEPPVFLPVALTRITYIAEDATGNKANCTFTVHVRDTQPPKVERCNSPGPFVMASDGHLDVQWEEPVFWDNSRQSLTVTSSHRQHQNFPVGQTNVVYTAKDRHGNNNTCVVTIVVKEHLCANPKAPANGNITCARAQEQLQCHLECKSGFGFAMDPAERYICDYETGRWWPDNNFPDCSLSRMSNHVIQSSRIILKTQHSCDDQFILEKISDRIYNRITNKVTELCDPNAVCDVENFKTQCLERNTQVFQDYDDLSNVIRQDLSSNGIRRRYRRDVTNKEGDKEGIHRVGVDFQIYGKMLNESRRLSESIFNQKADPQRYLSDSMQNVMNELRSDVMTNQTNWQTEELRDYGLETLELEFEDPQFSCMQGSVIKDRDCVDCPSGTYYNIQTSECEGCAIGTYQREEGKKTCQVCPRNTSTAQNHSKSVGECKGQCLPGTFSHDGLEPCETCPLGQYQNEYASTQCDQCSSNMTTLIPGSRQEEDCQVTCLQGHISRTGVEPCYPCPKGYFQPDRGKVACFMCPNETATATKAATDIEECLGTEEVNMTSFLLSQPSELSINDCFAEPCYNNATCHSLQVAYTCICEGGWTGLHCETEIDECQPNPCDYNATCVDKLDDFLCQCPLGFTGKTCSINIDECTSSPCRNNATCIDDVNSFLCMCAEGFNGTFCEQNVDECVWDPCENNATCIDQVASYRCICEAGFTGENCEVDIDECLSDPCQNEASCVDLVDSFSCICAAGFTGTLCETELDECVSSPCHGNATCQDRLDGYICECPPSFIGTHCEQKLESNFHLEFTVAGVTDYAKIDGRRVNLTAFTVTFWMKTDDTSNYGTVLSYANQFSSNALTISDYSGFVLKVNGEQAITDSKANDGWWHHLAVTWRAEGGHWVIYKDGLLEQMGSGLANGTSIEGGGVFVLGQDQDSVGGDFTSAESFIGVMSNLHVWDRPLSQNEIRAAIWCAEVTGSFIAWPDFLSGLHGQVANITSEFCQECPKPHKINNGRVTVNASLTEGLMQKSVAIYGCDEGYRLIGENLRTCAAYSDWDAAEPMCEVVKCGFPGRVSFAMLRPVLKYYPYGTVVTYKCQEGYTIGANSTRVCQANGQWSNEQPSCKEVICPYPSVSDKMVLPRIRNPFRPGDKFHFPCKTGFRLDDDRAIVCLNNGTWNSSAPTCVQVTCEGPPDIDHATAKVHKTKFEVHETVVYECNEGYKRVGQNYVRCLSTGSWSTSQPSCHIATCSKPSFLYRGFVTVSQSSESVQYAYKTTVTFACQKGYNVMGDSQMQCLASGQWNSSQPYCALVKCPPLTDIPHGVINSTVSTYSSVIGYFCDVGFDIAGVSQRVCQENGSWTNTEPTCTPISCPVPGDIKHGTFYGTNYTYQAIVSYSCNEGYIVKGISKRKCLDHKHWEKPTPECTPVECPTPSSIPNGKVIGGSFKFNNLVDYSCNAGFKLVGEKARLCLSNGTWSDIRPTCEKVTCPQPNSIENGDLKQDLEVYDVGSVVTYTCLSGYELEGKDSQTCRGDGTWSGHVPSCKQISCGEPKHIENGILATEGMTFGSRVQYQCNEGYQLDGPTERTCAPDKHWSGTQPSCDAILCEKPDQILHGNITTDSEEFMVGDHIVYECEEGFEIQGEAKRECLSNRTWSGEEPACSPVECPLPEASISNGRVIGKNFTFLATVEFVCDDGYELEGPGTSICKSDGTWNQSVPVCNKIVCPAPEKVQNIDIMVEDLSFKSSITYICQDRFELIGQATRTCEADGTWSGDVPKCIPIECPQPPSITNGKVQLKGLFYKDKVQYSCDPGYELLGKALRQCGTNRQWLGEDPSCIKIKCGLPPGINQGKPKQRDAEFGDKVDYECEEGYVMDRPSDLSCSPTGSYTGDTPQCVKVQCEDPKKVVNGNIILTGGNTYGEVIRYECRPGFSLVGQTERRCQQNGTWSGSAPVCKIMHCLPKPENITNGMMKNAVNNTFGSKVTYVCSKGYTLQGSPTITCLEDSTWSAPLPQCVSVECPKPVDVNLFVSAASGGNNMYVKNIEKFVAGMAIQLSCESGYILNGTAEVTCLQNGTWNHALPKCDPVVCKKPSIDNGAVSGSYAYQGQINIKCDKGYKVEGKATLTCQSDGQWSGSIGTCVLVSCEAPTFFNGKLTVVKSPNRGTGYPFGMTLKVICNNGYTRIGVDTIVCAALGEWTPEVPLCKLNYCPYPEAAEKEHHFDKIVNKKSDKKYKYKDELKFRCEKGFELNGNDTLICGPTGHWQGVVPRCNLKLCDPPVIQNGSYYSHYTRNPGRITTGSTITFDCNVGWQIVGVKESECLENKTWSYPAPRCKQVTCPPPDIANLARNMTQPVVNGEKYSVECKEGYEVNGLDTLTCGVDGTWVETYPQCSKVLCSDPYLANGNIVKQASLYSYQDVINITCDKGYYLQGSGTIACSSNTTWTPPVPECMIVKCPVPVLHHGRVKNNVSNEDLSYGRSLEFECDTGYNLNGASEAKCQADGTWSIKAECLPVVCPELRIDHATLSSDDREYEAAVEVICEKGFQLTGDKSLSCDASGKWQGIIPKCSMIQCPVPDLENGKVIGSKKDLNSDFSYGNGIKFVCEEGYELIGEDTAVCQADRTWSSDVPYCRVRSCGPFTHIDNTEYNDEVASEQNYTYGQTVELQCDMGFELQGDAYYRCGSSGNWIGQSWCKNVFCVPVDIKHGTFIGFGSVNGSYIFGDMGKYECEDGYSLTGRPESMCMPDESWSEATPSCERVMCFVPEIYNGYVTSINGNNQTFYANDTMLYMCSEGYFVDGEDQNTCLGDGNWDHTHPPCSKISCPALSAANAKIQDHSRLYGDKALVLCGPGYELTGSSMIVCQADGTWSDEPFCRQIKCPLPTKIENGEYMAEAFNFGSMVKYSCWEGYELVGEPEHECLYNQSWSGIIPICEVIKCPVPESPTNGSISFVSNTFKSVVKFFCDTGYKLVGAKEAQCKAHKQWSQHSPRCALITCDEPETPERAVVAGSGRSFGDFIQFSCEEGYELEKEVEQVCSEKGVWQGPVPMCVPVTCPTPKSLNHGYTITSALTYNTHVRYLCDNGFELEGSERQVCQANGTWSGIAPECQEVTCPAPAKPSNGHIIGSNRKYKAVIEYVCDKGFTLVGDMIRSCRADKSWSGMPPKCQRKSCPEPNKVKNGFYNGNEFTFGAEIEYGCDPLYELLGQSRRTCEADGSWSGKEPACQILECPPPRLNDHTLMLGDDTAVGSSVTFQCDQGYQLEGESTLVCTDSKTWNGHFPRCDKVSCGLPKIIENGQLDGNSYQYKDIVKFKCLQGYEIKGNPEIRCQANATWTPIQAECVPLSCGAPPEISHGFINGDSFQFGDFVYYHCKDGFDLDGNNLLQCGADGKWQGDIPECHMVTCGHAPVIRHASTIVSRTTMGSKARYHCNRGYILQGSPMVECMKDGAWKFMDEPKCVPVNCGAPPDLPYGIVIYPDTTLHNVAKYHCNDGFRPSVKSNLVLQCGSEAKWNGSAPVCEKKSCGTPLRSNRGGFQGDNFTFNATVIYWCDEGFVLRGAYNATCLANGTWDKDAPECEAVVCPAIEVANAHLNTTSLQFGVRVEVVCKEGYAVEGTNVLQCIETGEWDKQQPKCVSKRELCPLPSVPAFAVEPKAKFYTGDTWWIQCQAGYEANLNATLRCLPNATWTHSDVICARKSCGPPNMEGRVLLMGKGYNIGNRMIYMCRAGFLPQRSTIITCGEDGQWHPPPSCKARCVRECQNGGTCIGLNKCKCPSGFTGIFCHKAQCVMPCFNGGVCVGPYQCRCPHGYTGARCQKPVCEQPCKHGGICMRPNRCRCPRGFLPPFCSERHHRGSGFH